MLAPTSQGLSDFSNFSARHHSQFLCEEEGERFLEGPAQQCQFVAMYTATQSHALLSACAASQVSCTMAPPIAD